MQSSDFYFNAAINACVVFLFFVVPVGAVLMVGFAAAGPIGAAAAFALLCICAAVGVRMEQMRLEAKRDQR